MYPGYRAYVGPPLKYDLVGAQQFNILTELGLRDTHKLLDIGCGSLRAGRLFIPYLLPGNYYGIEPNKTALEDGISNEIGLDMLRIKKPYFDHNSDFNLSAFDSSIKFDFIIAQSVFSHASKSQIEKCFVELLKVMSDESVFVATYCKGDMDYEGSDWMYPAGIYYTTDFFIKLSHKYGFKFEELKYVHPNYQTWFKLIKQKT